MTVESTTQTDTETPAATAQGDAVTSLAAHEAQFNPMAVPANTTTETERRTEDKTPERERRRAQSQRGTPDDVDQINALTKEWRDLEKEFDIKRNEGESDRVYNLRVRTEIAKKAKQQAAAPAPKPTPVAAVVAPPVPKPPVVTPPADGEFAEPEPKAADYLGKSDDPYGAHLRAVIAWERRRDAWTDQQAASKTQFTAQQTEQKAQMDAWVKARDTEHASRMSAFITAHPDAKAAFEAEAAKPADQQVALTPVLYAAMHLHEQGPAFMLRLVQDKKLADELFLLTDGKVLGNPTANPIVATVQRRLVDALAAANTGSAQSSPSAPPRAPRPPNPVRTGTQTPVEQTDSAEDGSLAAHEKRYSPRPRQ